MGLYPPFGHVLEIVNSCSANKKASLASAPHLGAPLKLGFKPKVECFRGGLGVRDFGLPKHGLRFRIRGQGFTVRVSGYRCLIRTLH